jgi:hypothetical protein
VGDGVAVGVPVHGDVVGVDERVVMPAQQGTVIGGGFDRAQPKGFDRAQPKGFDGAQPTGFDLSGG